jgi:hypothetical protein
VPPEITSPVHRHPRGRQLLRVPSEHGTPASTPLMPLFVSVYQLFVINPVTFFYTPSFTSTRHVPPLLSLLGQLGVPIWMDGAADPSSLFLHSEHSFFWRLHISARIPLHEARAAARHKARLPSEAVALHSRFVANRTHLCIHAFTSSQFFIPMRRSPAAHPRPTSPLHPDRLASPTTQWLQTSLPSHRTNPGFLSHLSTMQRRPSAHHSAKLVCNVQILAKIIKCVPFNLIF